jgi:hypothetical protein
VGTLSLTGTLVDSPPSACDAPAFPSSTTSIPFTLLSNPKSSNVDTGAKTRNLNSPTVFVTLSGVGAGDDVTQADTIYARSRSGGIQLRVTFNNPAGGSIVSVLPLAGLYIHEPDAQNLFYATKIEAMGSGVLEYFASGAQ